MQDSLRFYRERLRGTYLSIDATTLRRGRDGISIFKSKAPSAPDFSPATVKEGETSGVYLHHHCECVDRGEVPPEWLDMLV